MAQLRRDPIVGRWVVIDSEHPKTPEDFPKEDHSLSHTATCPFCPGRESRTPAEVDAVRPFLAEPFRKLSDEDLACLGFWLVCTKTVAG